MSYFGVELNLTQTVLPRIGPHSCDNTPQINISGCRAINLANSNMDSLFPRVLFNRDMCTSMLVWLIALFAGMCGFHLIAPCSILTSDYTKTRYERGGCIFIVCEGMVAVFKLQKTKQNSNKQTKSVSLWKVIDCISIGQPPITNSLLKVDFGGEWCQLLGRRWPWCWSLVFADLHLYMWTI